MEKLNKLQRSLCNYCFKFLLDRSLHFTSINTVTKQKRIVVDPMSMISRSRCSLTVTLSLSQKSGVIERKFFETNNSNEMQWKVVSRNSSSRPSISRLSNSELIWTTNHVPSVSFTRSFATDSSGRDLPPKKNSDGADKSPISWKLLIVALGLAGGMLLWLKIVKKQKEERIEKSRQKYLGKAKLGGDWTLIDHFGNKRSSTDFRGQWLLIYFGFTHCPDICPEEIEKIVKVINKTDSIETLPKIQPMIISVDPERDTPEALKEYCSEFSPRLLGFTGTTEEISAATRAYRVYFSAGPKDEDKDYIVDHSIISYLVNPHGEFVDFYGKDKTVDQMYASIHLHIKKYLQELKTQQS
uniref:Thioredoxin domain-containing protein n=1 Tax=Biomphalaria glabrata TaxID=6526 RepID=A0A2C9JGM7_BIOGL